MTLVEEILVKRLGRVDYLPTFEAMRAFTARRGEATADEIWLLEHPPVYTLGQGAQWPSIDNGIALVQADRGGEITYHGPGQVVLYALVDLARRGIKVKQFVAMLESSVIELLAGRGERKPGAPGVYVGGAKIAALGIRVSLAPFRAIDPCGCPGLAVTQTRDLGIRKSTDEIGAELAASLAGKLEHA